MQCTVPGNNIKFLGKSISSLSRIGEDMYIETTDNGILLRTVNSSHSAYACFTFEPPFFSTFSKSCHVKCKVTLKSLLIAFRSVPAIEKNVDSCLIDTSSVADTLVVEFTCMKTMKKVYHLPFIENENVRAEIRNDTCPCKFAAQSRLLTDGIQNFCSTVEEVTLTISFNRLTFKNYIEDEPDPNKVMHTELTLESDEFEEYEVQQETVVTFCLKELRAFLNFVEGYNVPVNISCQGAGKPIMFNVQCTPGVKSEFVLATLADTVFSQISGISFDNSSVPRTSTNNAKKESSKRKLGSKTENRKTKVVSDGSLPEMPQKDPETSTTIHDVPQEGSKDVLEASGAKRTYIEENDVCFVPSIRPGNKLFLRWSRKAFENSWSPAGEEILVPCSDEDD